MTSNNMIKILLVSPYDASHVGGIGTWTKLVLDYTEDRTDVSIFFLNTASPWKQKALHHSITRVISGVLDSALILIKLFYNILKVKPEVIHYTSSASYALIKDLCAAYMAKACHIPFVIHWRFGRIPDLCVRKNREYSYLLKVINKSSASIVIDNYSYSYITKEPIVKPVFCIPNPISKKVQEVAIQNNVKKLFEEREKGTVLFVGHVIPTKGIYELINACLHINNVHQLYIVGPIFDEEVKHDLLFLAKEKGENWLNFIGEIKREDVLKYYRTCALFCLPSYTEGFPNVVLEAMANGIPIVASNVGAIPEMLEANCGRLIPPRDIEPLQTAISSVMNNPNAALLMAENACQKVLQKYTIETIYKEYYEIWESVAN